MPHSQSPTVTAVLMQVVPDMEWAAQGKFVTWTERLTRSCREFMYGINATPA